MNATIPVTRRVKIVLIHLDPMSALAEVDGQEMAVIASM